MKNYDSCCKQPIGEYMENRAKTILKKHGCEFIQMTSEARVLWKNRNNVIREDDVAVLSNMSETAWKFWETA